MEQKSKYYNPNKPAHNHPSKLVTDNKQLQFIIEEQQHIEVELLRTIRLLQNVINASQDLIFVKDTNLRTILCNDVFVQALGKTTEEIYGRTDIENGWSPELVKGNPEKNIRGFENDDREALTGKTVHNPRDPANINGEIRYFDTVKTPLRDEKGKIIGILGISRDITDRVQAEEALRLTELKYRLLFENTKVGIILFDTKGTYQMLNKYIAEVLGGTPEDFIGKTLYEVFPDQADFHLQRFAKIIEEKKGATFEDPFPLSDGIHWYSSNLDPVFDDNANVVGIHIVAVDITERKQAEEELNESEARFRTLVENAPEAIVVFDLDTGIFTDVNENAEHFFGLSREDLLKCSPVDLSPPTQSDGRTSEEAVASYIMKAIAGERQTFEWTHVNQQTGEEVVCEVRLVRLPSSERNLLRGSIIDVTERKQAEEELRRSQRNLNYAQKIAGLAYYYWYLQTNEVVWSDEMYGIFGVDKADFTPSTETFGEFLLPEDLHLISPENFAKLMENKTHELEFRIIDQTTNELKYIYLWGETTFDDQGNPESIFGIIQDITKRKKTELQLAAYTTELERSNRELQDFAYVASHDLQEPLRKIQTFGDRLQQKYGSALDDKGLNYLDRMQGAAFRMQELIVGLLAFSRVRTHTNPFQKVDLNLIVANVLLDLEIKIAEVDAKLAIDNLPVLDADALQMRQLFQNLLSNSLKFKHPDVPLEINISSKMVEPYCEISVVDNGIGFDDKYTERIFMVYERLHDRRKYSGTGVGLAICRRIVERHHGYIRAESQSGSGSTFTVGLPLKQTQV